MACRDAVVDTGQATGLSWRGGQALAGNARSSQRKSGRSADQAEQPDHNSGYDSGYESGAEATEVGEQPEPKAKATDTYTKELLEDIDEALAMVAKTEEEVRLFVKNMVQKGGE